MSAAIYWHELLSMSNYRQFEVDKTLNKLAQSDIQQNLLLNLQILRKL